MSTIYKVLFPVFNFCVSLAVTFGFFVFMSGATTGSINFVVIGLAIVAVSSLVFVAVTWVGVTRNFI